MRDLQSAGNAGEYYTPRAITQFMVDMVDPKLGEKNLDPACGTGGFLACAIKNIRRDYVKSVEDEKILQKSINGVEKKPLPHLLCVTNMLLHGIEVPSQIRHDNTLARPLRDYGASDKVDVIVTNPPFGGMEEDGIESNFPATYRTKETADLFLVLILHLLKEGGRCAIVLPTPLSIEGVKTRIKEKLLEECNLHTIVRLPKGVFNPYSSIETNILFFTKGEPTREIWFYEHPYPPGYKSYSKTKPIHIDEFEPEKAWWHKREENEYSWKVPIEAIRANNYNLEIKNPNKPKINHEDPHALIMDYRELLEELAETRNLLKQNLINALGEEALKLAIFLDNFELLMEAPNSMRRLRDLILKLAMKGKLVPQFSTDEPASIILERIKTEKDKLIKERKIKREKTLLPTTDDEIPDEVPKNWILCRLGEIISFEYGKGLTKEERNKNGLYPVFGSNGIVGYHDESLVKEPSIIVGRKGSTGTLNISIEPSWPTDVSYYIVPPKEIDIYFIFNLLKTLNLEELGKGIKPGLNRNEAYNLIIALPPCNEQKRIVAKVNQLMALCDELETRLVRSQADSERLMEAVVSGVVGK